MLLTGEAVAPTRLFEVRLTYYEDLVDTQTQFLKTLSELDVERRKMAQLEEVTQSGAISAKTLLERKYSRDKTESSLAATRGPRASRTFCGTDRNH